jgi:hypothetical protein
MKNLTDSQIIERKMASLTPEQRARWENPTIGLFWRGIRDEIQLNWIKEYREEQMLGEYKQNDLESDLKWAQRETAIELERATHYRNEWQKLRITLRKIEAIIQEDQIHF